MDNFSCCSMTINRGVYWSGGGTYFGSKNGPNVANSDSTKWTADLWRGHNGTDLFRDKNPSNLEIDFGQIPSQRYDWHRQKLNPGLTGGWLGTCPTTNTFSSSSICQYAPQEVLFQSQSNQIKLKKKRQHLASTFGLALTWGCRWCPVRLEQHAPIWPLGKLVFVRWSWWDRRLREKTYGLGVGFSKFGVTQETTSWKVGESLVRVLSKNGGSSIAVFLFPTY